MQAQPLSITFLTFRLGWLHALLQAIPVALLPQAGLDEDFPVLVTAQQFLRGEPLGTRQACIMGRASDMESARHSAAGTDEDEVPMISLM